MAKKRKPKKTRYRAIAGADFQKVKALLDQAVFHWHVDLSDARIRLVWAVDVRTDVDGRLVLGKAVRASDVDRELADYDLVVFLNQEAYVELTEAQRLALIDHELTHFVLVKDEDGEPRRDDRGRLCFRTRKHDIEEFVDVVRRHGCYLSDVERLVAAAIEAKETPLFDREAL